jgi:hypothetical protein
MKYVIVALVLLTGCAAAETREGEFRPFLPSTGRVLDAGTGEPIPGAIVELVSGTMEKVEIEKGVFDTQRVFTFTRLAVTFDNGYFVTPARDFDCSAYFGLLIYADGFCPAFYEVGLDSYIIYEFGSIYHYDRLPEEMIVSLKAKHPGYEKTPGDEAGHPATSSVMERDYDPPDVESVDRQIKWLRIAIRLMNKGQGCGKVIHEYELRIRYLQNLRKKFEDGE